MPRTHALLESPDLPIGQTVNWSVLRQIKDKWFLLPLDPANGFSTTPDFLLFYPVPKCASPAYVPLQGRAPDFAIDATIGPVNEVKWRTISRCSRRHDLLCERRLARSDSDSAIYPGSGIRGGSGWIVLL